MTAPARNFTLRSTPFLYNAGDSVDSHDAVSHAPRGDDGALYGSLVTRYRNSGTHTLFTFNGVPPTDGHPDETRLSLVLSSATSGHGVRRTISLASLEPIRRQLEAGEPINPLDVRALITELEHDTIVVTYTTRATEYPLESLCPNCRSSHETVVARSARSRRRRRTRA